MAKVRARGEAIRRFILEHVERHPRDICRTTAEAFGITRQAANKHLHNLVNEGALVSEGNTNSSRYKLRPLEQWLRCYSLHPPTAEDVVWRNDIAPQLQALPRNVFDIWQHGFTEMFNNAIDHSGGTHVTVHVEKSASATEIWIRDDGVGIFRKIQEAMHLLDERHAVLELAKGKLTTDPSRHTGEGIFFSSRMFDDFAIVSGATHFSHSHGKPEDWIWERETPRSGTSVVMRLNNHPSRTVAQVFSEYSSGDERAFTKTVVPVALAKYGQEQLVSRSQAKRLLGRVDRFKTVILDFDGVPAIGQAFADEIFRVFRLAHPEVELVPMNAATDVQEMIVRALATVVPPVSETKARLTSGSD